MVHEIKIWMTGRKDWQQSTVPMSLEMPESNHGVTTWFLSSWESFISCSFSKLLLATIDFFFFSPQLHYEEVRAKAKIWESF